MLVQFLLPALQPVSQSNSSLLSPHVSTPSHTKSNEIQCLLLHSNSSHFVQFSGSSDESYGPQSACLSQTHDFGIHFFERIH